MPDSSNRRPDPRNVSRQSGKGWIWIVGIALVLLVLIAGALTTDQPSRNWSWQGSPATTGTGSSSETQTLPSAMPKSNLPERPIAPNAPQTNPVPPTLEQKTGR